jgi:tetratricopeptide (TPR) repeat protein
MMTTLSFAQNAVPGGAHPSPAEIEIAAAQKVIADKPAQNTGYDRLALALIARARETSDDRYYAEAGEAAKTSLELSPGNFETLKIRVSVLLGEHEFPQALLEATALNKKVPDDVTVYGLLTDANVGLGNYSEAETSAQWMLNLLPGNRPALIHAARLRELFGDAEGAYELIDLAYQSTPPTESAERALLLTQMGHLRLASGDIEAADKLSQQALATFPDYLHALENLARVRIAQKRFGDAVVLLQRRYQAVPRAGSLYQLAEALQLAGRAGEAEKAFAEFEEKAAQESPQKNNSNRELVLYYADFAKQPGNALKIAQQEYAWRHDVYTLDAYAWALHVNGRNTEARKQIEAALAVGIRDPRLFLHAGEITLKLGDVDAVKRYEKDLAEMHSSESQAAESALASLAPKPARR